MSLAPDGRGFGEVLGQPVAFVDDCVGPEAEAAVAAMRDGDVILLENTRFHAGEEKNDPDLRAAWPSWPTSTSTMPSPPRTARMPAPKALRT